MQDEPVVVGGTGATCTIEINGVDSIDEAASQAAALAAQCYEAGLLVHHSGPARTRIVLLPPINMTDQEFALTTSRLSDAFHAFRTGSSTAQAKKSSE